MDQGRAFGNNFRRPSLSNTFSASCCAESDGYLLSWLTVVALQRKRCAQIGWAFEKRPALENWIHSPVHNHYATAHAGRIRTCIKGTALTTELLPKKAGIEPATGTSKANQLFCIWIPYRVHTSAPSETPDQGTTAGFIVKYHF